MTDPDAPSPSIINWSTYPGCDWGWGGYGAWRLRTSHPTAAHVIHCHYVRVDDPPGAVELAITVEHVPVRAGTWSIRTWVNSPPNRRQRLIVSVIAGIEVVGLPVFWLRAPTS